MSDENKALVRRFIEEVWNDQNYDVIGEIFSEDHVNHDPADLNPVGGLEGVRTFVETLHTAFPDAKITIDDLLADGDRVILRWHSSGTHQGELMGIAPTGRSGSTTGIGIDRVVDGKIVESWANWDTLGLLTQLGVIGAAAGAEA